MIPEFDRMTCRNCHYSEKLKDERGLIVGFKCSEGVFKMIPWDYGTIMHCGYWSEVDDDDRD